MKRLAISAICGSLVLAGIPTASYALAGLNSSIGLAVEQGFSSLTPASADPRIAALVAERGGEGPHLLRFTPAGVAERANRSVTVAVRVGDDVARAISVRGAIDAAKEKVAGETAVRIAPARYNLGLSRGYQSFAKQAQLSQPLSDAGIPDLAAFVPTPGVKEKPSRFAARIEMDDDGRTGAVRSLDAGPDQTVDVAGSYRLTRNLNVTAGVRYSREHDRLAPLADAAQKDSQAVYVGTQVRF